MGKPRSTGNELFDIVWAEYPPRNGRKETKAPSLKLFKKLNLSEEQAYDMVAWIKKDKESRESLRKQNKFCKEPQDMVRFLKNEAWLDEIGVEVTKSSRYEKTRSTAIKDNNLKEAIAHWQGIILEWPIDKLRGSKSFMGTVRGCSGFRAWALEQRPELKGSKAPPKPVVQPVLPVKVDPPTVDPVSVVADLPPPDSKQLYREVVAYAEKNGINLY